MFLFFVQIPGPIKCSPTTKQLHIAYHNGDHYSSVRRVGDNTESPTNIRLKVHSEWCISVLVTSVKLQNLDYLHVGLICQMVMWSLWDRFINNSRCTNSTCNILFYHWSVYLRDTKEATSRFHRRSSFLYTLQFLLYINNINISIVANEIDVV